MAYATRLVRDCSEENCKQDATYTVFNNLNEVVRPCCRRHALRLVAQLSEREQEET